MHGFNMSKGVKKNKTIARGKRGSKKEFEIPVFVIQNKQKSGADSSEVMEKIKYESLSQIDNDLRVVQDAEDLPILEDSNFSDFKDSGFLETKDLMEKAEIEEKISASPPEKRKTIMWFSVAVIAGLIFFIWLVVFVKNFSFSFGPQNPFTLQEGEDSWEKFKSDWGNLRSQWLSFDEILEQKRVGEASQQVIEKMKEKIFLEKFKNKLEVGESSEISESEISK